MGKGNKAQRETKFLYFKAKLKKQTWYFFNWEILIIVSLCLFAAFFNYLPHLFGSQEEAAINFSNGDKYVPNALRDNIVYSSFAISITIIVAIFIGIYTEIGKFAGKYSSAIFTLVPSLVWLFSARNSNYISDLVETQTILEQAIFYSSIFIFILFVLVFSFFSFLIKKNFLTHSKFRLAFIWNVINRILVVFANVAILFMLSYALVNFGFFTLNLGNISPTEQKAIFEKTGLESGQYNLQSEDFITYIAIIAILFALIMVAINLSATFAKAEPLDEHNQDANATIESPIQENTFVKKGRKK